MGYDKHLMPDFLALHKNSKLSDYDRKVDRSLYIYHTPFVIL